MYLTERIPAVDFVMCILFFVGVDEKVDPIAHADVVQRWVESETELLVAFRSDGGDFVVADVGEAINGFFQLLFVHVVDADDAVDRGAGDLLDIVFTRVGLLIKIEDDDGKES